MKVLDGIEYVGRARGYVLLLCEVFGEDALKTPLMTGCSPQEMAQADQILSVLSERNRRFLEARFGLKDGNIRSLSKTSQFMGLDRETQAGSIEAQALSQLRRSPRREKITFLKSPPKKEDVFLGRVVSSSPDPENIPTRQLKLSPRAEDALITQNLRTLADIISKTERQLRALPGMGNKSVAEVKEALTVYGLALKGR